MAKIHGAVLFASALCALGACTTNVENPNLNQTGRTGDQTCLTDCDDTRVSCSAKCTDDACRVNCESTHTSCVTSCSRDGG